MRCRGVKRFLVRMACGLHTADEEKKVKEHIAQCARCKAEYDSVSKTLELVAERKVSEPEEEVWKDFSDRLHQRIRGEKIKKLSPVQSWLIRLSNSRIFYPKRALGAATAVVIILGAILVHNILFKPSPSYPAFDITEQMTISDLESPAEILSDFALTAADYELIKDVFEQFEELENLRSPEELLDEEILEFEEEYFVEPKKI